MIYLLILIYSGISINVEKYQDLTSCLDQANKRIGVQKNVKMWDDMGGSNPIPKVEIAFCVQGVVNDAPNPKP